jgi:AraC-like DNA-binding protein
MLDIRYFDVPARLTPFIERALVIDFTHAVGKTWQFLPTGCFGVSLLTGPAEHDHELGRPDDDGAFSGIAGQAMGTWCERACLAFGISLTPLGVLHLPLHTHDFDMAFAIPSDAVFGRAAWRALRLQVRSVRTVTEKMHAFMAWMEASLFSSSVFHGRAAALAGAAQLLRTTRPLSVVDAANYAGVHRRQFERDFRRYFGTSPKRYTTVSRVQQVAQLSWAGLGLAGIAAELGFTDQAHMSHVVKDVTGLSPSVLLTRAESSPLARATRPFTGGRITHF